MNTYFPEIMKNFGFGMMRLPMVGDEVDIPQTTAMVDAFLAAGFNYFDTAHPYIRGKSELAIRSATPGTGICWPISSPVAALKRKRIFYPFSTASWRPAVWITLTFICSTQSAKSRISTSPKPVPMRPPVS